MKYDDEFYEKLKYLLEESDNVTELSDFIEEMIESKPDGRNKHNCEVWRENVNKLVERVNILADYEIYSIIDGTD